MKKLVFAAIAALVMVSVSNVFANGTESVNVNAIPADSTLPADTTVKDSILPAEQPQTLPADTTVKDTTTQTPQQLF